MYKVYNWEDLTERIINENCSNWDWYAYSSEHFGNLPTFANTWRLNIDLYPYVNNSDANKPRKFIFKGNNYPLNHKNNAINNNKLILFQKAFINNQLFTILNKLNPDIEKTSLENKCIWYIHMLNYNNILKEQWICTSTFLHRINNNSVLTHHILKNTFDFVKKNSSKKTLINYILHKKVSHFGLISKIADEDLKEIIDQILCGKYLDKVNYLVSLLNWKEILNNEIYNNINIPIFTASFSCFLNELLISAEQNTSNIYHFSSYAHLNWVMDWTAINDFFTELFEYLSKNIKEIKDNLTINIIPQSQVNRIKIKNHNRSYKEAEEYWEIVNKIIESHIDWSSKINEQLYKELHLFLWNLEKKQLSIWWTDKIFDIISKSRNQLHTFFTIQDQFQTLQKYQTKSLHNSCYVDVYNELSYKRKDILNKIISNYFNKM